MGVLCWVPSHKIVLNIYDEKLLLFLLISSSNPIFPQQGGSPLTPFPIPLCLQKSTVSSGTLAVLLAFLTNVILLFCVLTLCLYPSAFPLLLCLTVAGPGTIALFYICTVPGVQVRYLLYEYSSHMQWQYK